MSARALPSALLLDEGGVLSLSDGSTAAPAAVAARVTELLHRAGIAGPSTGTIESDIRSAKQSYGEFKRAHLRDPHPTEIGHRHFWRDLVAARWPAAARTLVALEAVPLSEMLSAGSNRYPAPGALDLLTGATALGIRIGLVANTFAAGTTRRRLTGWGFDRYLAVQLHSDEIGYRKPDPRLLITAMTALDVGPSQCWYVGDSRARDVECGRRAGVSVTVLMDGSGGAVRTVDDDGPDPDLRVRDCAELLRMLGEIADHHSHPEEGAA